MWELVAKFTLCLYCLSFKVTTNNLNTKEHEMQQSSLPFNTTKKDACREDTDA